MNKSELIESLSEKLGGKPAATQAVEHVLDTITRAVASGEKVAITGFGVFEKADRAARTGRNPATGAPVKIKKTSVPKFRPGAEFKAIVSGAKKIAKAPAKKATTTATAAKKTTVASAVKKVAAKKLASSSSPAVKKVAAKTLAKAPAKTTATKTTAAKKTTTAAKAPAKKTTATKTVAKAPAKKTTAAKTTAAKTTARKAPAKKASR